MAINPNLCTHKWNFACVFQSSGVYQPKHNVVLFCEKCAKIKIIKEVEK
jgi:hypothetical protein